MFRQIRLLTALQLRNVFGINEALYSRERRKRLQLAGMACLFALLCLLLCGYVGLVSWGLVRSGAGALMPLLLAAVVSAVILVFTVLRAGPVIFDLNSYERQISMPLHPTAIVVSRFLTMYVFDAALAALVLLPGTAVYGALLRPSPGFYPMMLFGALTLPLIPMTAAMLIGAAIYALSARMRRRNLAVLALSLLAMLALLSGSMFLSMRTEADEAQLLNILSGLFAHLAAIFPPAGWFAQSVLAGDVGAYLLFSLGSAALFALAAILVGKNFASICTLLSARASRRSFSMGVQRRRSAAGALYRREMRLYFSSVTYVLNTLTGELMAILMCLMLRIAGARSFAARMLLSMDEIVCFAPLVVGLMFLISPTTASTISMEGKSFWIVRSLPLRAGEILRAKLWVNLSLALPAWALCAGLLLPALGATGVAALWMLLTPLMYIFFGTALGLWINLRMPMLNWESDRQAVKQSRAVLFTMLGGFVSVLAPGAALALLPGARTAVHAVAVAALAVLTGLLWRGCLRARLEDLE